MNKALLHNKIVQAVLVALLAVCLLLTGTFAWYNITQTRTNVFTELVSPNVNLHDDFEGGANKDVYVENSGNRPVYLRVRLGEYLQTDVRGSLVQGQVRDEDKARMWAPHNGSPTADLCTLADGNVNSPAWGDDSFHKYYKWLLGGNDNENGWIYYRPATPEQQGEYDKDGNVLREPVVVSDDNTAAAPHYDAHLLYTQQIKELTDSGKTEAEAMAELGLEKTQAATVITMEQWVSGKGAPTDSDYRAPMTKGNYWVMETDGWCYWAAPLEGDSATGLLLDKVERTGEAFDSTAEYAINVWLQAVDKADLGKLWAAGNGGITENGKKLIELVAGNLILDQNGDEYIDNDNGSFTPKPPAPPEGGGEAPTPAPFIPLVTPTVNVPEAQRLHIGQRFTVGELLWDGTDYTNWADEAAKQAPYYNITTIEDSDTQANLDAGRAVYQATGSERGWDGNIYLIVAPVTANEKGEFIPDLAASCYLASLQSTADTTADRAATLPDSYRKVYPGNGPYAFVWQREGGIIGLPSDTVEPPHLLIGGRYFHELGSSVYIEVAAAGETVSKDTPVKYFFPGRVLTKTMLDAIPGEGDAKVNNVFPLQLVEGTDKYNVSFDPVVEVAIEPVTDFNPTKHRAAVAGYTIGDTGRYTAKLVQGVNGKQYLDLGDMGYLATGSDGFLGNKGDWRIWHGADGTIGTDDDTYMGDYTEPFLKCVAKVELVPGFVFATGDPTGTGGYAGWVVVAVDKYGNRFIAHNNPYLSVAGRTPYKGSGTEARMISEYNTNMPKLKPYILGTTTPVETGAYSPTRNEADALSAAVFDKSSATIFAPSQSEFITYDIYEKIPQFHVAGVRLQTRSPDSTGRYVTIFRDKGFEPVANNTACNAIAACWVRLSDAERIATATPDELEAWKNAPPAVGTVITYGTYPQNQAAENPKQPLEWKVAQVDGTKMYLICTKNVEAGNAAYSDNFGEAFMTNAFTEAEQRKILWSTLPVNAVAIPTQGEVGKRVFTLSAEEGLKDKDVSTTAYAKNKASPGNYKYYNFSWWRCFDPEAKKLFPYFYPLGDTGGQLGMTGTSTPTGPATTSTSMGIRPAMWVDLSKK